jgi:hypothetical protein
MPSNTEGFQMPANLQELQAEMNQLKTVTDVQRVKQYRQEGDALIQNIKSLPPSRETSLAITNIQQGVMWLGMELKRMGEANPYPSNKDPNTGDKIEPTADGLKF